MHAIRPPHYLFLFLLAIASFVLGGRLSSLPFFPFLFCGTVSLPGGPHFSYTFYTTVAAVITNTAGMAGVTLFTYVFSEQSYEVTPKVAVSLVVLAS